MIANMPLSTLEWVERDTLTANSYNPNVVFKPELLLLKVSIVEDGWTQPIVARPDGEIVDGYHRWLVSADPEVAALTDGLVPVVRLKPADDAEQRMATIRHNRARGSHHVLKMAEIVDEIADSGVSEDEIGRRLGMEQEEVTRLRERGKMIERARGPELGKGWAPEARGDMNVPAEVEG